MEEWSGLFCCSFATHGAPRHHQTKSFISYFVCLFLHTHMYHTAKSIIIMDRLFLRRPHIIFSRFALPSHAMTPSISLIPGTFFYAKVFFRALGSALPPSSQLALRFLAYFFFLNSTHDMLLAGAFRGGSNSRPQRKYTDPAGIRHRALLRLNPTTGRVAPTMQGASTTRIHQ